MKLSLGEYLTIPSRAGPAEYREILFEGEVIGFLKGPRAKAALELYKVGQMAAQDAESIHQGWRKAVKLLEDK